MKAKVLSEGAERTYAIILDKGDETISELSRFAGRMQIASARISAIGAFSDVVLGFFERDRKDYKKIVIREQVEVLSMLGDIALSDGQPKVHLHVVLGKADGTAHGGHLLEAHVWPTLEVMLIEAPRYLHRKFDPETKLPLIEMGGIE